MEKGGLWETYEMELINCECELSKKEIEQVLRRHKSLKQKGDILQKKKERILWCNGFREKDKICEEKTFESTPVHTHTSYTMAVLPSRFEISLYSRV